ncbi:MAG: redox-sensing transcriptional repressor Rex [Ignavibacteriales bacterium]
MRMRKPPDVVIRRLAMYLRLLEEHEYYLGQYISSHELGELAGVTSAQIRKDLDMFGEFGKQGVGYPVRELKRQLIHILKVDRPSNIAIIGIGELGSAFARYLTRDPAGRKGEGASAFRVAALLDVDPGKVGQSVAGLPIYHLDDLEARVKEMDIKIALLTVPAPVAQSVLDRGIEAGIRLFINFAPVRLKAPEDVIVNHADVSLELHQLGYYL